MQNDQYEVLIVKKMTGKVYNLLDSTVLMFNKL
jgi:hypothetical protein